MFSRGVEATSGNTQTSNKAVAKPSPSHKKPRAAADEQDGAFKPSEDDDGVIIIAEDGDVVLDCQAEESSERASFRVDSAVLCSSSTYFKRLLSDTRFAEGAEVLRLSNDLRSRYKSMSEAASGELPRLCIVGLGIISQVKSIKPLMTDFLCILHRSKATSRKMPIANVANIAIVADRFDATSSVARWSRKSSIVLRPKQQRDSGSEEHVRQRLLIGLLLDDEELVQTHSYDLIESGSIMWSGKKKKISTPTDALWWDLPRGVEVELEYRRSCVLRTIWSPIEACLNAYSSRSRQCRLGYDSSPQCDSFQLGEFVKFLTRTGNLNFHSSLSQGHSIAVNDAPTSQIFTTLRKCPSYQVDGNHSHCGPRKILLAILRLIESMVSPMGVGICLECWNDTKVMDRSWSHALFPITVNVPKALQTPLSRRIPGHAHINGDLSGLSPEKHDPARLLFTAEDKQWNFDGIFAPTGEVNLPQRSKDIEN